MGGMDRVGIVGLGQLGSAFATRLLQTGVVPRVYDVEPKVIVQTVAEGALAADSNTALAAETDVMLVVVRDDAQCRAVVGELLHAARAGSLIAVQSTITPETVFALAEQASSVGVELVDAPVAGSGRDNILAGEMTSLVGGSVAAVERLRPIVERFGPLLATGPLGSGATLKLAHNLMVYSGYVGLKEALDLARAAGVRDGLVEQITRASGTLSHQQEIYLPIFESRRDGHGSPEQDAFLTTSAALFDKDLAYAVAVAGGHNVALPAAAGMIGRGAEIYVVPRQGQRSDRST
jgi:3-hydroxyisobutyrate dehydrogenase-like beta-hydroxyacid dehydrogenase